MNSFIKYFFVLINLLFVAVGALCAGFALWARAIQLIDVTLTVVKLNNPLFYFGICLGGVLILLGMCGALGGVYEKKAILVVYLTIILLFVGCEVAALIYTIVQGSEQINNHLEVAWNLLSNKTKDDIQEEFECCGYESASEWNESLPNSCFANMTRFNGSEPFQNSCRQAVLDWFAENILMFGGALLVTILLQIFQIVVTSLLVRSIATPNRIDVSNNSGSVQPIARRPLPTVKKIKNETNKVNEFHSNDTLTEDTLYQDDTRGRNMNIKQKKSTKNLNSDW